MSKRIPIALTIVCLLCCVYGKTQDSTNAGKDLLSFPSRFINQIQKKTSQVENSLLRKSDQSLKRLQREEKRLRRKLFRKDSVLAKQLFDDAQTEYASLQNNLHRHKEKLQKYKEYLPFLDTLKTSLQFLEQDNSFLKNNPQISQALQQVKGLEDKLQQAQQIQQFLKDRRNYLKQQLGHLGMLKELKKYHKEVYYYEQQLNDYKAILQDPKKLERKAIEVLSNTKVFRDFMNKHSFLASIFRMPNSPSSSSGAGGTSLAGLQTRAQVTQLIQTQLSAAGPNAQQLIQQNIQQAKAQLQQLKDKLLTSPSTSGGRGEAEIPGFKPNKQRTKTFWQRLEYGTNLQTQKASYYFPSTSDIGLSVGYKLNDKSIIGVGGSYKIGWGTGWRNINITHQGAGIRSFLDWKLKGSFWLSGGYEMNYQQLSVPNSPSTGGGWGEAWQSSGLLGISKVVSLKSKLFKKTKLQLNWDFLSYRQVLRTQAIKFRIAYSF